MKRPLSQEELTLLLDIVDQNAGIVDANWKIINALLPSSPEDEEDEQRPTMQWELIWV